MRKVFVWLVAAAILVGGCAKGEPTPVESKETQARAAESASKWTPEQKDAMLKALAGRRKDK